jgi:pimeloyl-ACP methyl ester carboxylesterase
MITHHIDIPRGHFAYREAGQGTTAVIMLHGWPESSYCWEQVVSRLSTSDFHFYAPDLRGMGDSERSPEPSGYTKQELAMDIIEWMDALGITTCHLAGHDWGGIVAQEMALTYPERFLSLTLLNISIVANTEGIMKAQEKLRGSAGRSLWYQTFMQMPGLAEAMIPGNEEPWLRCFLRSPVRQNTFPEDSLAEYVRYFQLPGTATSTSNYYRTMKQDMVRWQTLLGRKFAMPGHYIFGKHDPVIVVEYLSGAETCFPSFTITEIEAGHFVQEEKPAEVAEALLRFWQSEVFSGRM